MIGGILFEDVPGLDHDSDGDVVFHAICNAITSVTGVPILGGIVNELLKKDGYTDSSIYVEHALKTLKNIKISHVALSIEGKRPRMQEKLEPMRKKIADLLHIDLSQIGITATSGDGLSDYGCGDGLHCLCIMTCM